MIRALRATGVGLQKTVHEDMAVHLGLYPTRWELRRPDTNIDHRRVANLELFFVCHGQSLAPSVREDDHHAGDNVTWRLDRGLPHIGIVSQNETTDERRPPIVHNIGRGPVEEDVLFASILNGHYRYPRD